MYLEFTGAVRETGVRKALGTNAVAHFVLKVQKKIILIIVVKLKVELVKAELTKATDFMEGGKAVWAGFNTSTLTVCSDIQPHKPNRHTTFNT